MGDKKKRRIEKSLRPAQSGFLADTPSVVTIAILRTGHVGQRGRETARAKDTLVMESTLGQLFITGQSQCDDRLVVYTIEKFNGIH